MSSHAPDDVGVVGQREAAALLAVGLPRPGSGEDGLGAAVLAIPAGAVADHDADPRGVGPAFDAVDEHLVHVGAAHDGPHVLVMAVAVQQRSYGGGRGAALERVVGAVNGLDPRRDGRAHLGGEDGGAEAIVDEREIQRRRACVSVSDAGTSAAIFVALAGASWWAAPKSPSVRKPPA